MALEDATTPGSDDWYFTNLAEQLGNALPLFENDEAYASGRHPVPLVDTRYTKALASIQKKARSNFIGMAAKAPVERMRWKGARFGEDGKADPDAKRILSYNNWSYQNQYLLKYASRFGRAYIMVSPPLEGQKWPVMTYEDPRMTITAQNPLQPTVTDYGLKMWVDTPTQTIRALMSTASTDSWYLGPKIAEFKQAVTTGLGDYKGVIASQFTLVGSRPNDLGESKIVLVEWSPDGVSQIDDLKDVQDRINLTILDRLVITRNQAYRQRWMTGAAPVRGKSKKRGTFDPGADMLWVTDNPTAKFGDFAQADIRQVLDAVKDDIVHMAAISKVPPHYLMGAISNVSGDTLTAGESGFVSMIRMRQESVGWGLERALKLAFKYLGDTAKAEDIDCEIIWEDPEVRNKAELADAAVKEASMFATAPPYALPLLMRRAGYDPDEIAFAQEEAEKWQQEQQDREDQMLQKQQDNALAVGEQNMKAQQAAAKTNAAGNQKRASTGSKPKKKTPSSSKSPGGSK